MNGRGGRSPASIRRQSSVHRPSNLPRRSGEWYSNRQWVLVLNTYGTGIDVGGLVRRVRLASPEIQILHIGSMAPAGLPDDVLTIPEVFTAEFLLNTVSTLIEQRLIPQPAGAPWPQAVSPRKRRRNQHCEQGPLPV